MVGVPVADATQWDQIERVADCVYPVFELLQTLAAQGEVIYQDDTHVRILSLMAENRHAQAEGTPAERTGMYTTGLVVQQGGQTRGPCGQKGGGAAKSRWSCRMRSGVMKRMKRR